MKIQEKIIDLATGDQTIVERDETADETKMRLDRAKEIAAFQKAIETKAAEKAAVLAKLGLTPSEVAALLS